MADDRQPNISTEFGILHTEVKNLSSKVEALEKDIRETSTAMHSIASAVRELSSIKDILSRQLSSEELPKMREAIAKSHRDIDIAFADIRHLQGRVKSMEDRTSAEEGKVLTTLRAYLGIAVFFVVIIQGMFVWYAEKFVSRADIDHDKLVVIESKLEKIEKKER